MKLTSLIHLPGIQDIATATEYLFPDAPHFGQEGWRLSTDAERAEINRVARIIMSRRLATKEGQG